MDRPPFVKEYRLTGGGKLYFNSGVPVSAIAIENFVRDKVGKLPDDAPEDAVPPENLGQNAAFWVMEGYLWDYELEPQDYESLVYYLENRGALSLSERWDFYQKVMDTSDVNAVMNGYLKTRRHLLETEAELSLDEKKSA